MSFKSLNDPFDASKSLLHKSDCDCPMCQLEKTQPNLSERDKQESLEYSLQQKPDQQSQSQHKKIITPQEAAFESQEEMIDRAVESAVVRSVFGHNEMSRRSFMGMIGGGTAAAVLGSIFPMEAAKAAIKETMGLGPLEKKKLNIGFVPITCATPIIMAHPMAMSLWMAMKSQGQVLNEGRFSRITVCCPGKRPCTTSLLVSRHVGQNGIRKR